MRCSVEGCGPGAALVDATDALAAIGVERVAHACQAAGLMGAATSAQACRFCGLVSRLATIRGGAASVGNLAEVTLGASVLVRAGCGEGECGGARLVGSEKSPIVTLRWCVGLGGLIENVLSRRGLRSPTELSGGASVICGNVQSSARIAVPVCGWDAPPDAAGTVSQPVAARALREESGSRCVRMAGLCRRSLSALGMEGGPLRLSQSDSRLYAVKLTEPDSITILSAYDST